MDYKKEEDRVNKKRNISYNIAIKNLTLYLLIGYAIGYFLLYTNPSLYGLLQFSPYDIINNKQIWRLVTWVITVPEGLGIFTIIMFFMYYYFGRTLEGIWGTKKYNIYIFSGLIFTVVGSMLLYFILPLIFPELDNMATSLLLRMYVSTNYINMSIFLAFAFTFAEAELMLYFLIKIKAKYIGYIYLVFLAAEIIDSFKQDRVIGIINICVIILSLLNFIIFKVTGNLSGRTYKTVKRQTQFKHNINKGIKSNKNLTAIHRCCVCGKTNLDDPDLEFRYCSKCSGNKEYCMEHLFKHEHK